MDHDVVEDGQILLVLFRITDRRLLLNLLLAHRLPLFVHLVDLLLEEQALLSEVRLPFDVGEDLHRPRLLQICHLDRVHVLWDLERVFQQYFA